MRAITLALATGLALASWTAPAAVADETIVVLEVQPIPGIVFVDNPAIVDPHPMPAESWSRIAGDRAVAVHFTTGTPECFGVHATVAETAESVTIELRGGTLPDAVGRACIMIAVSGTLEVPLERPLGSRQVLDKH